MPSVGCAGVPIRAMFRHRRRDTRDQEQRRAERLRCGQPRSIARVPAGVELAVGDFVSSADAAIPTLAFWATAGDSERVAFFVKTRLGTSADEANQAITRLEQFVRSVPEARAGGDGAAAVR